MFDFERGHSFKITMYSFDRDALGKEPFKSHALGRNSEREERGESEHISPPVPCMFRPELRSWWTRDRPLRC